MGSGAATGAGTGAGAATGADVVDFLARGLLVVAAVVVFRTAPVAARRLRVAGFGAAAFAAGAELGAGATSGRFAAGLAAVIFFFGMKQTPIDLFHPA